MLYGTTKEFLEVFGLAALEDLPQAKELRPAPARKKRSEDTTTESVPDEAPPSSSTLEATPTESSTPLDAS